MNKISMSLTASGTLACFKRLLECNAQLEEVDNNGATPLHYGCQQDEDSKHVTARAEIVQILLDKGVNLSKTDNEGRRPIHWASTSGNIAAFKILIDHGDDISTVTSQERMTPLHICAVQGHKEIVEYLVHQDGIQINAQDQQKCTPLFYACSSGHSCIAKILLHEGADPNLCNDISESPSHTAAMFGSVECLQLLFSFGANLSTVNEQNDTPLHSASSSGREDAVRFLLGNGCKPTVKNMTGATPLHYSIAERHAAVTEILLDNGAFVNALITTNETDFVSPLDIALQNNDHHLIDVLQRFGAKTGHRIVDNAALVIQNQWRVFKHRFSATVSVYPSNFSDSISIREGAEFRRLESDARQDSSSVAKGEKFVDDITYNSECLGDDEKEDDSQSIISKLEKESLNCSFDAEEGALFARNVELDQIHQLKIETVERIRLSKLECNRTDNLLKKADDLVDQLTNALQETDEIVNSKEFKLVLSSNERKARRSKSMNYILPQLPSIRQ